MTNNPPVPVVASRLPAPLAVATRAPLRLNIADNGLLLNGLFEHWVTVAIDGDRGDAGAVQLLVDVTSIAPSTVAAPELFSFHSRRVKQTGSLTYTAKGTLHAEGGAFPMEASIQAANTHTPFFLLTFNSIPKELPLLWHALDESVAIKTQVPGEVHARGWFKAPDIAVA